MSPVLARKRCPPYVQPSLNSFYAQSMCRTTLSQHAQAMLSAQIPNVTDLDKNARHEACNNQAEKWSICNFVCMNRGGSRRRSGRSCRGSSKR